MKPKYKPNWYKKKAGVPRSVSQFMAQKGSIGGKISAHVRHGTPLPPEIVELMMAAKS